MKITYLFLVYKNAELVYHTCQQLKSVGVKFLVHVDRNSSEDFSMLKSIEGLEFYDLRYATVWGGSGLVKATASCLDYISKNYETDFVILMSESDYPVKSAEYIESYLRSTQKDYAVATPLPCEYPLENKNCYWLEGGMRRVKAYPLRLGSKGIASIEPRMLNWGNLRQFGKVLLKAPLCLPKALKLLLKQRRQPLKDLPWCGGDQWFILRRVTVDKIVALIESDKRILAESDNTIVPDEVIFATLLHALSPVNERENKTLRYIHWKSPKAKSPSFLTMDTVSILETQICQSDILFVRKVEDINVAKWIDEKVGNA
ncbi:MAG: beta-1,6-N-acetylglucosaminyltransferase [Paludibacteraceae bacterium]|nr:beta-1,6-N-acetylglucosaminyltransferase [Paludibacteraceae bacterium]